MLLVVLCLCLGLTSANYYGDYNCWPGRDAVVHLFEWKWTDVQKECEFLAEAGYCALQVILALDLMPWGREFVCYSQLQ
jgi:alpha-amylase